MFKWRSTVTPPELSPKEKKTLLFGMAILLTVNGAMPVLHSVFKLPFWPTFLVQILTLTLMVSLIAGVIRSANKRRERS